MANEIDSPRIPYIKPLDDKEFRYISGLIYQYCGINLHEGKRELVRSRLCKRLRELEMASFKEYCEYLENHCDPEEMTILIDTLSTNMTSFFREHHHFDFLERELVNMVQANRAQGRTKFRIWSTACSSGEEPYSLAITACETLTSFPSLDVKILATDVSERMLAQAIKGEYKKEKVEKIAPHVRYKYFKAKANSYVVEYKLKHMVKIRRLNVVGVWPFKGPFDIIFCRNMMIYFDKKTQRELVERYADYLTEGGLLFLGHSESLVGVSQRFKYVEPSIYRKL